MFLRDAIKAFDVRNWLSEKGKVHKSGKTNIVMRTCPICCNRSGKFYANAASEKDNGKFTAYCCHHSGGLVALVNLVEGFDDESQAMDFIKGIDGDGDRIIPVTPVTLLLEESLRPAISLPSPTYPASPEYPCFVGGAWGTLRDRGVDDYIVQRHGLLLTHEGTSYAGDHRQDLDYRFVIPVLVGGALLSWQARDITGQGPRKYLFPSGDRSSEWLYDLDAHEGPTLLICEGAVGKWSWDATGKRLGDRTLEHVAVASFGKKLTASQIELLLGRRDIVNIVFAWDDDAASEVGRIARELSGRKNVYVMPAHPSGRDHDELSDEERVAMWSTVEAYSPQLEIRMKTTLAVKKMERSRLPV